jgi:hypothetical protein
LVNLHLAVRTFTPYCKASILAVVSVLTPFLKRGKPWLGFGPRTFALPRQPHEGKVESNGSRTYQITFIHKASKKPLTLGPGTIKFIVEELQNRGRYLSKDAVEALAAILTKIEDNDKAEINNKIPYPGFCYIEDKIVGYDVTQRLDFDPYNNQEHKKEALECIEILDGLQLRNKKKTAFPTLL